MDYDTYMLMQADMAEPCVCGEEKGDNCACEEEECITCKAAPCRCDAIYDAWREDGAYI